MRLSAALAGVLVLLAAPALAQQPEQPCVSRPPPADAWPAIERQIRQNYAYLGRTADSDALFARAARSAAGARTTGELAAIVNALGYAFRDGHFHARPLPAPAVAWIPSAADLWAERDARGRTRIVEVKRGSRAAALGIRPGWEVEAIEGVAIDSAVTALFAPVLAAPDAEQRSYGANVLLAGKLATDRRIRFRTPAGPRDLVLPPGYASTGTRPAAPFTVTRRGQAAIIRFNNQLGENAGIAAFDTAIAGLAEARAIVLDLRDTPSGGNTAVARGIMGHFVAAPRPYQVHRNAFEEVVHGVPRQAVEYVFPRGTRFTGKLVVLAGRWTGSVGEAIAIGLDAAADAHSIGTGLGDLLGTLNSMALGATCGTLELAWDRLLHVDGRPREDWLPREVLPVGEVAHNGADPALTRALAYLEQAGIAVR